MTRLLTALVAAALATMPAPARDWQVPDGVGTVAAALDSASWGDHVVLAPGIYEEADLSLRSGVTLRGESGQPADTVIDAGNLPWYGSVIRCEWRQGARLDGLTITGGQALSHYYGDHGGGLHVICSDLEVVNCVLSGNRAYMGGAVAVSGIPEPVFRDCVITGNSAVSAGGFEVFEDITLELYDCLVEGNTVEGFWPEGMVRAGGAVRLICCETDLEGWGGEGTIEVDDLDCGSTPMVERSWGWLKKMFGDE